MTQALKILFIAVFVLCLTVYVSASMALFLGLGFALLLGNPFGKNVSQWGGYLLKTSVVGLGFGINIQVLLKAGQDNIGTTTLFVIGVLTIGYFLGKALKIDRQISLLVSVGTAICGGSAIAAVGSVIKADANQLSMATGVVFLLNAMALVVFPTLGHWAGLSEVQFGTWAAIAIHDTSSVVGTAAKYGDEALRVASITKMLRILWIIPVSLALVLRFSESRESFKIPSFIIGFVLASCLFSFVPVSGDLYKNLYLAAKQGLVASLFLIGAGISLQAVRQVGLKVLVQAVVLWVLVSIVALLFVKYV
ncbi:MAG: putative sulfate exporter family transporter [Runella slithyformis]|nr:MAG: putative sulfate exporter family transporter [Runella slithyformis]TAF48241.1 MAG: putative sulfate exporter family transporter [Runella slithyformis]